MANSASAKADVVIIGAGVAGLTAAGILSAGGLRVGILEARDRIGGRILTIHGLAGQPHAELGAEFVHGIPENLWRLIDAAGLTAHEFPNDHRISWGGPFRSEPELWRRAQKILDKVRQQGGADRSFSAFLSRQSKATSRARELALNYVEGLNAADAERISLRSLKVAQTLRQQLNRRPAGKVSNLIQKCDRSPLMFSLWCLVQHCLLAGALDEAYLERNDQLRPCEYTRCALSRRNIKIVGFRYARSPRFLAH